LREDRVGRVVLREHPALAQDRDSVAQRDRLIDVVRHEEHCLLDRRVQTAQLLLEARLCDRVERAERLVHQQQRWIGSERAGEADALPLAAGELCGIALRVVAIEADELEQLRDARARPRLRPAEQARHRGHVVGHGQVREQADLLDDVADPAS
jgi:hypothetical protein